MFRHFVWTLEILILIAFASGSNILFGVVRAGIIPNIALLILSTSLLARLALMFYLSFEVSHLCFELREVLASIFSIVASTWTIAFSFCGVGRLEQSIFGIPATIRGIVGLMSPVIILALAALTEFLIVRFLSNAVSFGTVTCFAYGAVRGKPSLLISTTLVTRPCCVTITLIGSLYFLNLLKNVA